MKMLKVAAMLLACAEGTLLNAESNSHMHVHAHTHAHAHAHTHAHSHMRSRAIKISELDMKENKLSQSFASAFEMAPPKLMTTKPLPGAGNSTCPTGAKKLTYAASGGAFIDGCYMNTTRSQARDEATGEEAQHYLYMWKHACAFTKWVPSNQFMYSNLDYDNQTMTLERFGFIGMDKKCFWGAIGVLWKRPLPVNQIMPNSTITTVPETKPQPKPEPAPGPPPPAPPSIPNEPVVVGPKKGVYEIQSRINPGNNVEWTGTNKYDTGDRIENALSQHFWITGITSEIYVIQSEKNQANWFEAHENAAHGKHMRMQKKNSRVATAFGDPKDISMWFRMIEIKKEVYALESMLYPGWYVEDPGVNRPGVFKLRQVANIMTLPATNEWGYFNIHKEHD